MVLPAPAAPVIRRFSRRPTMSLEHRPGGGAEHAARLQDREVGPIEPGKTDRDGGALGGDRRQHRVHADSTVQPHVHARGRVVDVSSAESDESDREIAHVLLGCAPVRRRRCALTSIDEQTAGAVDEQVRHIGIVQVAGERLEDRMPHGRSARSMRLRSNSIDGIRGELRSDSPIAR